MCMLFIKPSNFSLPENYHNSLWKHNSDGVSIFNKGASELVQFLDKKECFTYLTDNASDEMIVHYRFGTSGKKSKEQLHGWIVADDWHFFHNGVLKTFGGNDTLSDTQEMVSYFNQHNFSINDIVSYLEMNEKTSRFLLINQNDHSVIKPKCAQWNLPTVFNCGNEITFSNTYAIDYHLLGQDDDWYIESYNDEFSEYADYFAEIDFLINHADKKELTDFIAVNPEIVAEYLKGCF